MLYKNRIDRLDILKGIGIIMVLLGHSNIGNAPHIVIYNCHMALFFFASGFFYKPRTFYEELSISFKRLIIPFLFFLLLWSVENILLAIVSGTFESVAIYITNYNVLDENCSFLYTSIWFLLALFLVRIFSSILFRLVGNDVICVIICFGMYLIGFMLSSLHVNLPLFIDTSISVTIYYCLGFMFRKSELFKKKINYWFYCLLLAVYIAICVFIQPEVDLKKNVFPIYSIILSSLGIYALYQLCYDIEMQGKHVASVLLYLGCISLSLFGLHRLFFKLFHIASLKIGFDGIVVNIVIVIVTILCILPLDRFLTKKCPVLLGKSKK